MHPKYSLTRRIQRIFLAFTFVFAGTFCMLAVAFSWMVEDNIFNRLVAREADFLAAHYARTGEVTDPRPGFMDLYPSWQALPEPIQQQRRDDPERIEFAWGPDATIHVQEVVLGEEVAVLVANVAVYEVSRDYLPVVSLWIPAIVFLTGLLAVLVAWLAARSAVLPLRRLTETVAAVGHRQLEPGFSARFDDDEVGFLAQTIETGIVHLQSALARETDFTRDLSHELRTPVSVLVLLGNELDREERLSPQSRALFQNTVADIDQTIATLLALARQENIELRETALLPILEESIIQHFQWDTEESFDLHLNVSSDVMVTCNPHLAKILCGNLLTNARRYAAEPWLRIEGDGDGLVFENAAPADPSASQGLGQGLSLIQRVGDRFGWRVTVAHEATVFRVHIAFKTP